MYTLLSKEVKLKQGLQEDRIVTMVDELFWTAIKRGISDIHLQPTQTNVSIRFRLDGILYNYITMPLPDGNSLLSRLKVLASLDISERRLPQDGRFHLIMVDDEENTTSSNIIDMRIATFPTLHGEKIVIRILDSLVGMRSLPELGLSSILLNQIENIIKKPYGLFLITGPTGCGKTTMLYALLSAMNLNTKNIITIEDPIEYELKNIAQSQVNQKIGFTFDIGLRSLLRQDPDVIMIGEIRDKQTASIAIEAALTGHLVLSTLHTNDAASAITRLIEMGIESFLINATLIGVLAQRLVRILCQNCLQKTTLPADIYAFLQSYNKTLAYLPKQSINGCTLCNHIGYKGRIGIFELLMMNEQLQDIIIAKPNTLELRKKVISNGTTTLFDDGIEKVKNNITSLEEILAVTIN